MPGDGPTRVPLTFDLTARRSFEVAYWRAIATLSGGRFLTKNNADCARDARDPRGTVPPPPRPRPARATSSSPRTRDRSPPAGLEGKAFAGDLPFHWRTDFDFAWSDGWRANQGARNPASAT